MPFFHIVKDYYSDLHYVRSKSRTDHIIQKNPNLVKNFPNLYQFSIEVNADTMGRLEREIGAS